MLPLPDQALDAAKGELDALAGGCERINASLDAAQRSGGGLLAEVGAQRGWTSSAEPRYGRSMHIKAGDPPAAGSL